MKNLIAVVGLLLLFSACSKVIPGFVPGKKGKLSTEELAMEADKYFWDNFHAGNFDSIPQILEKLQSAYYENNKDYKLAAHIGFTHAWAMTESHRNENQSVRVIDHSALAVKYFQEAFDLYPGKEWRYYGFLTSMSLVDAGIHGDDKKTVENYFLLKKAARKYPEFNLFTAAYTLIGSPRKKDRDLALEMLWKNIDKCVDEKVDRNNLDYRNYFSKKDLYSKKSTCWNTWIAPHNMEGFLLVLGDELFKRGRFQQALMIYSNIMYFEEYEHWNYKEHLQNRMETAEEAISQNKLAKEFTLLKYDGCMICHEGKSMRPSPQDVHSKLPAMEVSKHLQ